MSSNQLRFSSVEEIQDALSRIWDVQITQSGPGALIGELNFRSIGNCLVYGSQITRPLVCLGQRSKDHWTITPISADCASSFYQGRQIDEGTLLMLDPGGEVLQRIMPGHRQNAFSIPLPLAERIIWAEYQTSPERVWQRWCVKSDRTAALELNRMLQSLLTERLSNPHQWGSDIDLATQVIALTQRDTQPDYHRPSAIFRRRVVARAEELIRSRLEDPPSITELCEFSHASRRALFYAFNELLGRSPSMHAKILRLHAARRQIISGRHQKGITQIAIELGFNHPGQFAIDYTRTFGERPSETRRQARSSTQHP